MKRRFNVNQRPPTQRVYGIHAVAARLEMAPPLVERVYVRAEASGRVAALAAAATRAGVELQRIAPAVLRELCGSDHHQGVVADVPPFHYRDIESVLIPKLARVVVLDQLRDPQNFGALLRSAEAAGVGCVVVPKDGAVRVTPSVEKAAAGAAMRVPVALVVNVARTLQTLKDAGFWIIGLSARAPADLFSYEPPARVAIVLGGEEGLRRLVEERCDVLLAVPMQGQAESLNASVAGALAMYALRPRSRTAGFA